MDIRGEFRFAAAALIATREAFVAQNQGFAAKIAAAAAYRRLVEIEDLERLSEDDREWAGAGACQDLAMTFGVSASVAKDWAEWGIMLPARYPATWAMVQAGRIQESHVRMLARKLDTCPDNVVRRIERAVGEAAEYVSVTRLGWEIEDLIARADPDEAATRCERRAAARTVRRRQAGDGLVEVIAVLTSIEDEIVDQCLASIAATVCPDDQRNHKQLRADCFMALIQGHKQLKCLCGNDTCPVAFYEPPATVHTHLHLHVDFEVLLRLVDDPGFLEGVGPIDAELARELAGDASRQIVIDVARQAAKATAAAAASGKEQGVPPESGAFPAGYVPPRQPRAAGTRNCNGSDDRARNDHARNENSSGDQARDETARDEDAQGSEDDNGIDDTPEEDTRDCDNNNADNADNTGEPGADAGADGAHARSRPRQEWELSGIGWWISQVHARITADPDLLYPDGHGGHDTPPQGALRYKPIPGVRREVLSTYLTCSFPPCFRPSSTCEFEHAVPYDHDNPLAGGWSITANGHPAHKFHHDLKTLGHYRVAVLDDGAVVWMSRTGAIGVSVPDIGPTGHHPVEVPVMRPAWEQHPDAGNGELPDDHPIYDATWWEENMGPDATAPTAIEIAGIDDLELRARCEELRARYDEHAAIAAARKQYALCPF